jgi:hypothetical protein
MVGLGELTILILEKQSNNAFTQGENVQEHPEVVAYACIYMFIDRYLQE